jgi:hypothetical protein
VVDNDILHLSTDEADSAEGVHAALQASVTSWSNLPQEVHSSPKNASFIFLAIHGIIKGNGKMLKTI